MDLSFLKELEREKVLEVLQRDKILRALEEERIRKLKSELQELRRKGAKSFSQHYSEKSCARCQRPLGKLWNCGAVCKGCSHRICSKCRIAITARVWKCTVCYAYREVKIRSGEWFLEERAKKFPIEADKQETVGEKLLKSYQRLSNISIVPPTPPPFLEDTSIYLSKPGLTKVPSLPILSKKTDNKEDLKSNVNEGRPTSHLYSEGKKRESICSISSTCTELGNFDKASVTGEIELSIAYNFKLSCLEISVRACKNLAYGDTKRKRCNPYVKIYLLPDKSPHSKLKTAVKKNTVDPVFNETFRYNIERSQLETRTLQASLWHSGTLKRKVFLGEVLISLDCWKFEDNSTQSHIWYQLSSKPDRYEECVPEQYNGELMIKVKFSSLPQGSGIHFGKEENQIQMTDLGQLSVLIIGAKNLPSLRPDGTVNSFVK
uniref:Synaptotagmin like 3 n=1 Tax=Lepisosteus oculatus TaxID=7918 RepID=W5NHW5_LEPOC